MNIHDIIPDLGEKAFDPDEGVNKSVIKQQPSPSTRNGVVPPSFDTSLIYFVHNYADDIIPWSAGGIHARDKQLRDFITKENIFASALGIICSRNAGFSWKLDGPKQMVKRHQEVLEMSERTEGWHDLIVKTSIDLYTQDNGAFWEVVREDNTPDSPLLAINHLDSQRCWRTGYKQYPVVYMDFDGRYHVLAEHEVVAFSELPSAVETAYGAQYCALTRLLLSMQIKRNIDIRDFERTSGRDANKLHLIQGITTQQMNDAMSTARADADARGLMRFMRPVVVGSLDPRAAVSSETIDLTDSPEGYKPEETFKQYINLIAMAFESDYQEFAPLPGGGLGTGAQSEMLHLKSRGKGPGTFMKMIAYALNFKILPPNLEYFFDEQDLEAEKSDAEVRNIRAQTRALRIASFEITPEVARQIANDEGDLALDYIAMMGEEDITPGVVVDNNSTAAAQMPGNVKPQQITPVKKPTPNAVKPNNLNSSKALLEFLTKRND